MTSLHPNSGALAREKSGSWRLLMVVSVAVMALVALAGVGVWSLTGSASPSAAEGTVGVSGDREDEIALAPFPQVQEFSADAPPPVVSAPADVMKIPATADGSPEGAIAALHQSIAEATVDLDPAKIQVTLDRFVMPNDSAVSELQDMVTEARTLRARSGFPASGPVEGFSARNELAGGLIRGTSKDFASVCVIEELWISYPSLGERAVPWTVCSRLWWKGTKWLAEARPSAKPPQVWPNTQPALDAGFRPVEVVTAP